MVCTICGRLVTGPALSFHVTAEAAVVHEGRVFRAGAGQVESDWLICPDCQQAAGGGPGFEVGGFIRTMANGLAKKAGG